jgi:hypothetical protein
METICRLSRDFTFVTPKSSRGKNFGFVGRFGKTEAERSPQPFFRQCGIIA